MKQPERYTSEYFIPELIEDEDIIFNKDSEYHNILETQLILGKQVLEIVLDLLKNDSKAGVVLPLNINDHDFTITIEKEVTD